MDLSMTAFEDGRLCPSLESFLEISVKEMTVSFADGVGNDFQDDDVQLGCRLRILGNAMSLPPLPLGVLIGDYSGQGCIHATLNRSEGGEGPTEETYPTMYPIDKDLSSTILAVEVSGILCTDRGLSQMALIYYQQSFPLIARSLMCGDPSAPWLSRSS